MYTYIYMYVYIKIHVYIKIYVYEYIFMYIYMYMPTFICIYIYICFLPRISTLPRQTRHPFRPLAICWYNIGRQWRLLGRMSLWLVFSNCCKYLGMGHVLPPMGTWIDKGYIQLYPTALLWNQGTRLLSHAGKIRTWHWHLPLVNYCQRGEEWMILLP